MSNNNYHEYKITKPLTKAETRQVISALTSFIVRVCDGRNANEAETAVLPEVVRALKEFSGIDF